MKLSLIADATTCAKRRTRRTAAGYHNVDLMLKASAHHGAEIGVCERAWTRAASQTQRSRRYQAEHSGRTHQLDSVDRKDAGVLMLQYEARASLAPYVEVLHQPGDVGLGAPSSRCTRLDVVVLLPGAAPDIARRFAHCVVAA